jgi:hypothetical protein
MTTQDLYTKVVTGEITEQKFLYEVRRDTNLPWITSSNTFSDTVKILKNRGMVSEKQTKLTTGKQEVEIISKTIDMVNPYEYAKGMNIELGVENEAVGNAGITEEDIKKAQKKVLKNLTKDQNYYSKKNTATMGDSEYDVEVNAKSIADLEKKNKGKKGKIIREHGEEFNRVADVNADSTPLEEESVEELGRLRDAIYEKYAKKHGVDVDELKDKLEARKMEMEAIEVEDEDTAIAVQKKSPDSDVRIVKR